ncbi:MAG: AAC(3) family N-acetyltransferase [Chloroflexi bacterium]|nr:AAC(3) family N-acetyltransferase [Chloroflexota bacterium]
MPQKPSPVLTQAEIAAGLRALGLHPGMGVMLHSSLSSFGHVEGGALAVIAALEATLTPAGTLLMPSFNHGAPFEPGGPGVFDPLATPTTNGAIPDAFWRQPGVHRSLDPTHAYAAWGAQAEIYTRFHHRTLTMGPASPYGTLLADDGWCLLLGVGFRSNTFHHVVEMSTGAPCLGQRTEEYPIHLPDGRQVRGRTWGWRGGHCPLNDAALYAAEFHSRGIARTALIGSCRATLYRLREGYEVIARGLAAGYAGSPPCSACPIRPRAVPQTVTSDWDPAAGQPLPDSAAWTY